MYGHAKGPRKGTAPVINDSVFGESIEDRIERLRTDNEAISAEAPIIHTNSKEGVRPEYDIRTDKMELAIEVTDIESKNRLLRRKLSSEKNKEAQERLSNEATKNEGGQNATNSDTK